MKKLVLLTCALGMVMFACGTVEESGSSDAEQTEFDLAYADAMAGVDGLKGDNGGGNGGKGQGKGKGKGGGGNAGEVIVGTEGDDVLFGTDGDDLIYGLAGDDTLIGGDGNDFMDGGDGSDTYLVSGYDGVDRYLDTGASYEDAGDDWDVVLAGKKGTVFYLSAFNSGSGIEEISAGGFGGVDIRGTAGDNVLDFSAIRLTGIAFSNGLGGDDAIVGSWGDDMILGGGGNDTLAGGEGDDLLAGGSGADFISGGSGSDTFILGNVHDAGDTIIDFTSGVDVIHMSGIVFSVDFVGYSLVQSGADTIIRVEFADGSTNDVATLLNVDAGALLEADFTG